MNPAKSYVDAPGDFYTASGELPGAGRRAIVKKALAGVWGSYVMLLGAAIVAGYLAARL